MTTPEHSPEPYSEYYRKQCDDLRQIQQWREPRSIPDTIADFSSNDYLGLSRHPALVRAAVDASKTFGVGSTGSRLISGHSQAVARLEKSIAAWKGTEAALVFNSGYQANVAILQALLSAGDFAVWDKLNHASLIDGIRLSGAKWRRYKHLGTDELNSLLNNVPTGAQKWVVTDTLFSMDGNYPDLPTICDLAERHGAFILVDEAHAGGVFGQQKRSGLCEAQNVSHRITLQMGTFSKALGGFGAYVAGSETFINFLINKARGFIYSTALPPASIAAAQAAIDLVQKDATPTEQLWANTHLMWELLADADIVPRRHCKSQIIPIPMQTSEQALKASQTLWDAGFFVQAIRPPTVPKNTAMLRISISARHTEAELHGLTAALKRACAK